MKKVIFLFALVLGMTSLSQAQSDAALSVDQSEFSIEINNETSREQLMELRDELTQYGVQFQYAPSFDSNAKLNGIKVRMSADNGAQKFEYALNPMKTGDSLFLERTITDGEVAYFVGEKAK